MFSVGQVSSDNDICVRHYKSTRTGWSACQLCSHAEPHRSSSTQRDAQHVAAITSSANVTQKTLQPTNSAALDTK